MDTASGLGAPAVPGALADIGPKPRKQVFDRLVDAKAHKAEVAAAINRGTYIDAVLGRQTFDDFSEEWAAAQDTWKNGTREAWPYIRARLRDRIGDAPLASIDQLALKKLRGELTKAGYAPATVKVTMAYAGMVLRAAYTSRRIGHDPTAGLRHKRSRAGERDGRVRPEDVPTRDEALAILASAPDRYRAAVALGLAGLRVGEVLGMSADRLDLRARQVTVDRQLQRHGGRNVLITPKAEKVRTVTVPGLVAVELRRHVRDHQAEGLLFRGGRTGEPMRRDQFYASAWRPALRGAGLAEGRFVFHACRHWCASTLLAEGAPITAVAGHLGDTGETVSRIYVHWLRDDRDVPASVLDRVLAPSARHDAAGTGS
ncbi:MAG: tyrosine-type recombinase/integrase [Myxococcota bacterium]